MTDTVDELYDVKTAYYIGAFAQCINTAQKAKIGNNDDLKLERDCYVYRSYSAFNNQLSKLPFWVVLRGNFEKSIFWPKV